MQNILFKIKSVDWESIARSMDQNGCAVIPGLLAGEECDLLRLAYDDPSCYRKTVIMERYRLGLGEYKYFDYPLPDLLQTMRTNIYPHLVPIANAWFRALSVDRQLPETHAELVQQCREKGQQKATPLILTYGKGGFNTLHQDLYGEVFFPMQLVLMLSQPDADFMGGELVLTEQVPRAQSKAIVLTPGKGDAVIFATSVRPKKGTKGYYRVNMKHGVSEVKQGERCTLGIIFHDATS
jgi:hypothetical protein